MEATAHRGESRFYQSADGLRLHARDYDPGVRDRLPLVCLAGLTRNGDDFAPLAQALAFGSATPRRVVALDYRGRGLSDHDPDWRHYDLAVEGADILAGLAALGIASAHWLGTSRGGLNILGLTARHKPMMASVVLNDIGPVLEKDGLARIKSYVGKAANPATLADAIARLKAGPALHFTGLDDAGWRLFATTTFGADESRLGPRYDLALAHVLDAFDLDKPIPDLWPAFDALAGLPLLVIRGTASDLLSEATFEAMAARWTGCEGVAVPGQGHAPLLADAATIARIESFLARAEKAT